MPAARVQEVMDVYAAGYKKLKNPRSLHWQTELGVAEIEVHLGGRSRVFQTSASRASVILRFEEKPEWLASELAATVEVSDATLRGHAGFWVAQGVLHVTDVQRRTWRPQRSPPPAPASRATRIYRWRLRDLDRQQLLGQHPVQPSWAGSPHHHEEGGYHVDGLSTRRDFTNVGEKHWPLRIHPAES